MVVQCLCHSASSSSRVESLEYLADGLDMDTMYLESFILIKSVIVSGRGLPWVSGSLRLR